jgi:hypothetical protein
MEKTLTVEDQAYVGLLSQVMNDFTKKFTTPEYSHYWEMWKAILGGFVCKELSKYTTIDPETQQLIDEYTPDKIRTLTSGKVEKVEVIVEKEVIKKVMVEVPAIPTLKVGSDPTLSMVPGAGGNTSGVLRHKPLGVQKVIRKTRELTPEERMIIITAFNKEQRLVDKDNPICTDLIKVFPTSSEPSFPAQVAGYWSFLCTIVVKPSGQAAQWHVNAVKKGSLPASCPLPTASANFQKEILDNLARQRALQQTRNSFKAHMSSSPVAQPAKTATLPVINFG